MAEPKPDRSYPPPKVAWLLNNLAAMLYVGPRYPRERDEPRTDPQRIRQSGMGLLKTRIHELVDIERALFSLPDDKYVAVFLALVLALPMADVADVLGLRQAKAARLADGGVVAMCRLLGWEPPEDEVAQFAKTTRSKLLRRAIACA